MATHKLKTVDKFKIPLIVGLKKFEFRINDRDFKKGDLLNLIFINEHDKKPNGDYLNVFVDYVLKGGEFGIPDNFVIMSISLINFYCDDFSKDFGI